MGTWQGALLVMVAVIGSVMAFIGGSIWIETNKAYGPPVFFIGLLTATVFGLVFFNRYKKYGLQAPGDPLPHILLRPFVIHGNFRLDDKQYVLHSPADKAFWFALVAVLILVLAAGNFMFWLLDGFKQHDLVHGVLALIAGSIPLYTYHTMKTTRFITFDRETGLVTIQVGLFRTNTIVVPFKDITARISLGGSYAGIPRHSFWFQSSTVPLLWTYDESNIGIEYMLGHWFFLVQYMEKDAPLPNVPDLKEYPNRTMGLGSWEDWKKSHPDSRFTPMIPGMTGWRR